MTQKVSLQRIRQIIKEEMRRVSEADDFDDLVTGRKKIPGWITKDELKEIIYELTNYVVRSYYTKKEITFEIALNILQAVKTLPAYVKFMQAKNYKDAEPELLEYLTASYYTGPYVNDATGINVYPKLFKFVNTGERVRPVPGATERMIKTYVSLRSDDIFELISDYYLRPSTVLEDGDM